MRITTCHSTGRAETGVLRLLDGERRTLIIMCPWGQSPAVTFVRVKDQLTEDERVAVAEAFGLGPGPSGAA